jgi:hypothetical protein
MRAMPQPQKGAGNMTEVPEGIPERKKGRKPVQIDLVVLEKLCMLHCTDEEIAGWFKCSVRTIEKRRKHPEVAAVMQHGRATGRISLRRSQVKLMEAGNGSIAIWLGKQLLGQRDGGAAEHARGAGGAIEPPARLDLSLLTDAEADQLRELVLKIRSAPAGAPDASPPDTTSEEKAA